MIDAAQILALADSRRGHFRLESGYHSAQWLDLEPLFVRPDRVQPFAAMLAHRLGSFAPDVICGPLVGGAFVAQLVATELRCDMFFAERAPERDKGLFAARYQLPRSLGRRASGRRIAIVDDVISAGSSVRATYLALRELRAVPVAIGALLQMGDAATPWFAEHGLTIEPCARTAFEMWPPDSCPLCASGAPLETPA